jgi:hypothetical protein
MAVVMAEQVGAAASAAMVARWISLRTVVVLIVLIRQTWQRPPVLGKLHISVNCLRGLALQGPPSSTHPRGVRAFAGAV